MKRTVEIRLPNHIYSKYVMVDNKPILFKRDNARGRMYIATYETKSDQVEISFDTFHPLLRKGYWIKEMLMFFFSFFGLFDIHHDLNYIPHYKAVFHLHDDNNVIFLKNATSKGKSDTLIIEDTDLEFEEIENGKEFDKRIISRKKGLTASKVIGAILLIVLIIIIVIVSVR